MSISSGNGYSLSSNQENLWRSHYLSTNQNHLNMFTSWLLPEDVNIGAIKRSFQTILDKYVTLRTNYHFIDEKPVMTVNQDQTLDFHERNLSSLSVEEFDRQLSKEAHIPFDLEKCLMKIRVYENHLHQKVLLINIHHIAIDGMSMMIIMKEFGIYYDIYSKGEEPPEPKIDDKYLEFSLENSKVRRFLDDLNEEWIERLGEGMCPVDLPSLNSNPHSFNGDGLFFSAEKKLAISLKETAKANGTNLYIILLAAFQALLHRYSQQEHIWIGTPYFNRSRKTFTSVGFYAETLYIDGNFPNGLTFSELIKQTADTFEQSKRFIGVDLSALLKLKQGREKNEEQNHVNVMFNFPNLSSLTKNNLGPAFLGISGEKGKFGSLEFEVYPLKRTITQFEIELDGIESDGGLTFRLLFDPDKYDRKLMKRFTGHFLQILEAMAGKTDADLLGVSLLSKEEKAHQLDVLNHPELIKKAANPNLILEIEEQARLNPDAIAVRSDGQSMTYLELSEKSNNIAGNIVEGGIGKEERIGLAVSQSADSIAAILGILKAGAVYVPLDLKYPADRLDYMIKDAGIKKIIIDGSPLDPEVKVKYLRLNELLEESEGIPGEITPEQLAYIIYTSGSTGRPKGVMVSHENIYYSTKSRNAVYGQPADCRFLILSSISFDSSMVGILWTLTVGGELILTDFKNQLDVNELLHKIENLKISHLLSVPSMVQLMFTHSDSYKMKNLTCAIVAGEPFPKSLHRMKMERFPGLELYNEYGPTEGTVWSSFYKLEKACLHPNVPIGFPPEHARLYILDQHLNLVPQGTEGEIFISGRGVTRGYNNDRSKTSEKFLPDPFGDGDRMYMTGDMARYNEDGSIQFLGRKDGQVKVNGFRIEVGEIEAAVEEQPGVNKAVVLLKEDSIKSSLSVFISASEEISVNDLKKDLSSRLPHYMLPSRFVIMPAFPLTQNGKVDNRKLLEMDEAAKEERQNLQLPQTQEEIDLFDVFAELLEEEVSMNDSFFEIGGDSILAIQVSSKLFNKGWTLKPKDIFERKTIGSIARAMKRENSNKSDLVLDGPIPLTPIQEWFFAQDFQYRDHWNQAIRLRVNKEITYDRLKEAFIYLMSTHPSLNLKFIKKGDGWIQEYTDFKSSFSIIKRIIHDCNRIEEEINDSTMNLQSSLNVSEGPVVAAGYFECESKEDNELVIIAHHLIVDMVSWQIILQDMDILFEQIIQGQRLFLSPENYSYAEWSHHLHEQEMGPGSVNVDVQHTEGKLAELEKGTEGNKKTIEVWLEQDTTTSLLREVPKYFETKVNEVILAATALSLKEFSGDRNIRIDIESHGREPFKESIDLSRTIGWFTSVYPVMLNGSHLNSPDNTLLKHIKNSLVKFGNSGVSYGIAKWLKNKDINENNSLFSYNYLGKIDQAFLQTKNVSFHSYLGNSVKDPGEKRVYLLEFEPHIFGDRLCVRIHYSLSFSEGEMKMLGEDILGNVRDLVAFCSETEEIGLASSDFKDLDLDQETLDKFLMSLK